MSCETVWAVEIWVPSHWKVIDGGLTQSAALAHARRLVAEGEICSIAEYSLDEEEGSSAINRIEVES